MSAVLEERPPALPAGWYWTTMGEIAEVVGGGTPRTTDPTNFQGGDIPWITPADLSGYAEKYIARGARFITQKGLESSSARLLPAGTVLFTSRAPIGYVAIARNALATNQGFKSFVLKDCVLPEYVYWWLKGSKQRAEALASGTTFLELSGANAKRLPIPVAPMDEQRRIVAELEKQFSRLDEAVANLKRVKANLKRYRAAVLAAATKGELLPGTGPFGSIPLAEICGDGLFVDGDWVESKDQDPAGDVRLVQLADVGDGEFRNKSARFLTREKAGALGCTFLKAGDLLVARMPDPLGRACIFPGDAKDCVTVVDVCILRPDLERVDRRWLMHSINAPQVRQQVAALEAGSTRKRISRKNLASVVVPAVPKPLQMQIAAEVDRHLSSVEAAEASVLESEVASFGLHRSVLQSAFSQTG